MTNTKRTKSNDAPKEAQINTPPIVGNRSIEGGWIPVDAQAEIQRRSNATTYNGLRPMINKVLAENADFIRANNLSANDVNNMRQGRNAAGMEWDHYRERGRELFSDETALGNLRLVSHEKHVRKLGHKFNDQSFLTHKGLAKPKRQAAIKTRSS